MADELIEVQRAKPPLVQPTLDDLIRNNLAAVISALESAGYVVGRMRWEENRLRVGPLLAGVINQAHPFGFDTVFDVDETGFATEAEARAACERAVRKAMMGE